jgi:pyridinium-3,5-biscarboxylic acid mononucleotide synthase
VPDKSFLTLVGKWFYWHEYRTLKMLKQRKTAENAAGLHAVETVGHFAKLDVTRHERTGIPEAVFAGSKTHEQVVAIVARLAAAAGQTLATHVSKECAALVRRKLGRRFQLDYHPLAQTLVARRRGFVPKRTGGCIAVVAAGTADVRVAEEARVTAEVMGCAVLKFYDVGIAGIHRLIEPLHRMHDANIACAVVCAGMEGALPAVVRGLLHAPVIGVPVSTGYGFGGRGEAALMTMLQSCAPGLTVVNIDNGFGAGATAALIANRLAAKHPRE